MWRRMRRERDLERELQAHLDLEVAAQQERRRSARMATRANLLASTVDVGTGRCASGFG
jgi:hypothetical protein